MSEFVVDLKHRLFLKGVTTGVGGTSLPGYL